jgi:hypothetical protein
MISSISVTLEPLLKQHIFKNEEDAVQELTRDYVSKKIFVFQNEIKKFENKYKMNFLQFSEYLQERSILLSDGKNSNEERNLPGKAIMLEEDDWLEWKSIEEMYDSWLGIRKEVK